MKRHSSEILGCTLTFIADKAKLIRIAWNFYTSSNISSDDKTS